MRRMLKASVLGLAAGLQMLVTAQAADLVGWLDRGDGGEAWMQSKAKLQAFGEEFETSEAMFEFFKEKAGGGTKLTWEDMKKPEYDWSGIFTRSRGGLSFDPDVKVDVLTAKLTPEGLVATMCFVPAATTAGPRSTLTLRPRTAPATAFCP